MDLSRQTYSNAAIPPPPQPPPAPASAQTVNSLRSDSSVPPHVTLGTVPLAQQHHPPPQQQQPLLSSYPQNQQQTPSPSTTSTFRAPAHKHAHHLHSIPPREKSTRTLIIDHLLWVHARTRFAQARAELGMTDRTGGPGAPNYAHRERPEQWEEDEEAPSDGEQEEDEEDDDDVDDRALRADSSEWRGGGLDRVHGDNDEGEERRGERRRIARQDLPFARRLRQRAESLEKVVTGMLEQPPRDIPFPEDEPIAPVPPQQQPPPMTPSPVGKHVLPNGVRLRLALTTIINDLFARQAPVHRRLHFQDAASPSSRSDSVVASSFRPSIQPSSSSSSTPSPVPPSWLPQSLVPFLSVSSAIGTMMSTPLLPHSPPNNLTYPAHQYQQQPSTINPSPRVRDMFSAGVDPSSSSAADSSPTSQRCPRHLHRTCEICVNPGRGISTTCPRGTSHTNERAPIAQSSGGSGISGFAEGAGVGSGLMQLGSGGGMLLRRGISPLDEGPGGPRAGTGSGNTRLAEFIPRFVRLSALVALELGREVGAEGIGPNGSRAALAPTAQWYFLLAGLLTRAVLEGYLISGWTGLAPARILLGVGLGLSSSATGATMLDLDDATGTVPRPSASAAADEEEEKYYEFEPDGLPNFSDAVDVLFPGRRIGYDEVGGGGSERREGEGHVNRSGGGSGGEAEYMREMGQRLVRFLDVPASTPDLPTHLVNLTWLYPAEPVERAALRYCEALARWRGKPELETRSPTTTRTLLEGGIGSAANAAVRSAIGRYFVIPHMTSTTTTTATTMTAPTDILVSAGEGEREGEGPVVIGRKRTHSVSGAATSNANGGSTDAAAAAGDRWRERRGYI
ncbi:hypothetical protein BJV74DRAFT_862093 [Russula compacta]|nr:hypothetical protein BJV74DRAFT_862093 [Russula compacta]